jgi:predicted membrane-bound spermidine synthase
MSSNALAATIQHSKSTIGSFAIGLIFFVSGMPALVYQLVWQRSLFTMYGINIEAVTVVVAGFLLGLGFGSLAGGYLSRRPRLDLLAAFGAIELTVGGLGFSSLHVIKAIGNATVELPIGILTVVTLALLFVPTLFMGSTLPILTAYLVRQSLNVGRSTGLLYCVNTLGAAFACFACAFFLMRVAGMQGSVTIAAAINVAAGTLALAAALDARRRCALPAPVKSSIGHLPRKVSFELVFALGLSALIGYIALSYEIIWFRAFSLATNTSAAFALILGTYLAGLGYGALRARRRFDTSWESSHAFDYLATALLVASILGFLLLPLVAYGATIMIGYFSPMLVAVFFQTTVSGSVFPIVCHLAATPDERAGARVSWVYVANILGSVTGTLVTGFVLLNEWSIADISVFLAIFGTCLALIVALRAKLRRRLLLIAASMVALVATPLSSGFLFDSFYDRLLANSVVGGAKFVDIVENRSGVITVDEHGYVYGSGAYDGRVAVNLMRDENLLIRPFALSLVHAHPEDVLMVGLATGAWAQVIANHPSVKRLTIVEINPGYLELIAKYPVVANLLRNPKVEIIIDDGRRWLNRHRERRFDAIIQNTTFFYRPNVTNLLSTEYLALVEAHLREGGIFMYNTTGSLRVLRTGCKSFPNGVRLVNVLVLGKGQLTLDVDRLHATLAGYRINDRPVLDIADPKERQRMAEIVTALAPPPEGMPRPAAETEDCQGILARTKGMPLITDDNMGEEWFGLLMTDPLLQRLQSMMHPGGA